MPERFKVVCIPRKALYKCSDLHTNVSSWLMKPTSYSCVSLQFQRLMSIHAHTHSFHPPIYVCVWWPRQPTPQDDGTLDSSTYWSLLNCHQYSFCAVISKFKTSNTVYCIPCLNFFYFKTVHLFLIKLNKKNFSRSKCCNIHLLNCVGIFRYFSSWPSLCV